MFGCESLCSWRCRRQLFAFTGGAGGVALVPLEVDIERPRYLAAQDRVEIIVINDSDDAVTRDRCCRLFD